MAALTFFGVTGTFSAALKDSVYDVDTDPELAPMSGSVTFTPLIDSGNSVPAVTLTPASNLFLVPIKATIRSGVITSNGAPGVKLVANTAVLGLTGNLYYQVDFGDGLTAGGKTYSVRPFTFQAPTTATTVDLVEVTPATGQPATGPVPSSAVLSVAGRTGNIVITPADVVGMEDVAHKNAANGYAGLDGNSKISLAAMPVGAMEYKGVWNASTNTPTLTDGTGTSGFLYRVGTAGTRNLGSGSITWDVGDYAIHNGTAWEKSDATDAVTSVAGLTGAPSASALRAALNVVDTLTPEQFGAVGNGSTNDLAALNACFAAAAGKTVWLDPSKVYAHNSLVTIGQNGTTVTGGGTLKATNSSSEQSCVIVTGNNVTINHVTLTCPTASVRRFTGNDCKLMLLTCDGTIVRHVTMNGSSNFGFLAQGATNFYVESCLVENSMADGFQSSYGSTNGQFVNCSTVDTGDDGFSVISYAVDPAITSNITNRGFSVKNSSARGISVVGGANVRYFDGKIDNTTAAAIYIACELPTNPSYGVTNVVVSNVDIANANSGAPGTITGAVLVFNDRATPYSVDTISITDIRLRDTDVDAARQVSLQKLGTGALTGVELGPMVFSGTVPASVLVTSGVLGPADIGFNGTADYVDNIAPSSTRVRALDFVVGGTAEYRFLANLPIDDSGNVCSLSLAGRIGGWTSDAFAQWQILLSNRSSANDGITVKSAVFGQGAIDNVVTAVDVVVYAHVDKSASVYIKHPVGGFYCYDFDARVVGAATIGYSGVKSTSVPSGTLIWSLSTAPKLTMDTAGVVRLPASVEIGNASDTTLARSSAGNLAVEGNIIYRAGGTDVPITDGGTGVSTLPTGLLKGAGTGAITAAAAGTDYLTPSGSAASLTSFPTLNQSTTGSAATLTTSRNIDGQAFNGSANITVIAPGTHAASNKSTPVDADEFPMVDSAASNVLKKTFWSDIKTTFAAYYNSLTATLTNKTLDNPRISNVLDTNGNSMFAFVPHSSAVNYFLFNNGATGEAGWINVVSGVDTNVTLVLAPQAAGSITGWANSQADMKLQAAGSGTDVSWNLATQNAGRVKENGNVVGSWVSVPATATSAGKVGQQAADSSWLYTCTATNTWRRVAIASW